MACSCSGTKRKARAPRKTRTAAKAHTRKKRTTRKIGAHTTHLKCHCTTKTKK